MSSQPESSYSEIGQTIAERCVPCESCEEVLDVVRRILEQGFLPSATARGVALGHIYRWQQR